MGGSSAVGTRGEVADPTRGTPGTRGPLLGSQAPQHLALKARGASLLEFLKLVGPNTQNFEKQYTQLWENRMAIGNDVYTLKDTS